MKRIMLLVMLCVCAISAWYATANFTEKRVKKGPSMATLKEQCCEQFGEIVDLVPDLLRKVALVQEQATHAIRGQWQGDKESFCSTASRQKLTSCRAHLETLHGKIAALCTEMDSCVVQLNSV